MTPITIKHYDTITVKGKKRNCNLLLWNFIQLSLQQLIQTFFIIQHLAWDFDYNWILSRQLFFVFSLQGSVLKFMCVIVTHYHLRQQIKTWLKTARECCLKLKHFTAFISLMNVSILRRSTARLRCWGRGSGVRDVTRTLLNTCSAGRMLQLFFFFFTLYEFPSCSFLLHLLSHEGSQQEWGREREREGKRTNICEFPDDGTWLEMELS